MSSNRSQNDTKPVDVLFIAGQGRSGSTLLEQMLGEIPGFCPIGELKYFWDFEWTLYEHCSCGLPFQDCPFWDAVFRKAFGGMTHDTLTEIRTLRDHVDRVRYMPQMLWENQKSAYAAQFRAYADVTRKIFVGAQEISGASVIIDSSKDLSTLLFLSRVPGLRVFSLHLIRDSRGVTYSWTKQKVRPEITDRVAYLPVRSPTRMALEWVFRNIAAEILSNRVSSAMQVRYEDFARTPQAVLKQIGAWIGRAGLPLDFVEGNQTRLNGATHVMSGNPVRFERGALDVRLDDAWRTKMPTTTQMAVTALTWPLLWRYGYFGKG